MTIALITAVIGGIDEIKNVPAQSVEYQRYVITESYIPGDDRKKALYFKTQMHHEFEEDIFIWIDGKIQVACYDFVQQCMDALGDGDIAIMKHNERNCIYQEVDHIEHCIKKGNKYLATRYKNKPIRKQVERYRRFGYPANNGLNDCCIFIVRNNERMKGVFNQWWAEIEKDDAFDQTAIQFHCWVAGVKIKPIIFKPGSFVDVPHIVLK